MGRGQRGSRGRGGRGRGRGRGSGGIRKKSDTKVVHTYQDALKDSSQKDDSSSDEGEEEELYLNKEQEPDHYKSLLSMLPEPSQYRELIEKRRREQYGHEEDEDENEDDDVNDQGQEKPTVEGASSDDYQGSSSDEGDQEDIGDDDEEDGSSVQQEGNEKDEKEEEVTMKGGEPTKQEDVEEIDLELAQEEEGDTTRLNALKLAREQADPTQDVYLQHYQCTTLDQNAADKLEKTRLSLSSVDIPFSARALGWERWDVTQPLVYGTKDTPLFSKIWDRNPPLFGSKSTSIAPKKRTKQQAADCCGISLVDLFEEYNVKRKIAEEWAMLHSDVIKSLRRAGADVSEFGEYADPKLQLHRAGLSDIRRRRKRLAENPEGTSEPHVIPQLSTVTSAYMSPTQRMLFELLISYRDVFWFTRNVHIETQLRSMIVLHVTNHISKARELELKHTSKIRTAFAQRRSGRMEQRVAAAVSKSDDEMGKLHNGNNPQNTTTDEDDAEIPSYRDQGFTRPRVLVLAPFRHSAFQFIRMMMRLMPDREWQHKARFFQEFSDPDAEDGDLAHEKNEHGVSDWTDDGERDEDDPDSVHGSGVVQEIQKIKEAKTSKKDKKPPGAKLKRPLDYEKTFEGNIDDAFRIGISVARKSVRLYSEFYHADIVVASPLGLRINIGSEMEEVRDTDFLSCIEMAVVMQADVIYMQNWEHLKEVFTGLNKMPKDMHGADFSRIREIFLDGFAKHFRQTILLSDRFQPEMHSLLRKQCCNIRGCAITKARYQGSITHIIPTVKQVFYRIGGNSLQEVDENRFDYFSRVLYPQLRAAASSTTDIQPYTLIYVPSYFDFVQLRNFLNKEDVDIAPISEYSPDDDVSRARTMFYQGRLATILTTERFHFYRRLRIRGVRHIVFYSVPTIPHFYSELLNLVEEATSQSIPTSSITLVSRFEKPALERVVGTERAHKMVNPESKSTFLFT